MKVIWEKFWNDEDFAVRAMRGLGVAVGAYIMSGGLEGIVPSQVGIGIMGVATMFSGGASGA